MDRTARRKQGRERARKKGIGEGVEPGSVMGGLV